MFAAIISKALSISSDVALVENRSDVQMFLICVSGLTKLTQPSSFKKSRLRASPKPGMQSIVAIHCAGEVAFNVSIHV